MKVLIIEDESEILSFLTRGFESEYFVVDQASDGEKGLYLARENKYDLIVLDNVMPGKTGLEICRILRSENNPTPILMLSVKTEVDTKVELLNAGADDYLTKPFSFTELLARSRALLRRSEVIVDEIVRTRGLVLDPRKHLLTKDGEPIELTKKEFMLLEYLLRNQNTVLSRGMILEKVWETCTDPFSNTIEAHIRSLRKKIDAPGKESIIKTIPGTGYKVEN